MLTLYDLLGTRPGDDAASLDNAFRSAVKTCHPDLHPDDPEAASRLRQIVHANAILRDAERRRAYDQLLAFELWQHYSYSRPGIISDSMRRLMSDAIAIMVLAVALAGGYSLFTRIAKPSVPTTTIANQVAYSEPALAKPEVQSIS